MSGGVKPVYIPFTYDDYACIVEDGQRHELIDGDFFVSPAPSSMHQTVSRRLQFALMQALEMNGRAVVFNAPFDVILENTTVIQPDLAVIRSERKSCISQRGCEGAPDLIVEILSPSTKQNDERLKRNIYARSGIAEYWIVDPTIGYIDVLVLTERAYVIHRRFDRSSVLTTPSFLELEIPLHPVFAAI